MVFINLPTADLERATAFFAALGFRHDPQFSDENATCVILGEGTRVMLLTAAYFATFTTRAPVDARGAAQALFAISAATRDEVDDLVDAAIDAGGHEHRAAQDQGFMYGRAFEDLDGNVWEVIWVDLAAAGEPPPAPSA